MLIAGAWSWRILVLVAVAAVVVFVIIQLRLVVIPLFIAIIVSALLVPVSNWLQRHRWPRGLAIAVAELGVILAVAGLVYLVTTQILGQYSAIREQSLQAYENFKDYLSASPLQISEADIGEFFSQLLESVRQDSGTLVNGALSVGSSLGHVIAGVLLVLFTSLFILIDGRGIWSWMVRLFPRNARAAVQGAGVAGWTTLQNFVKVQILVALIDAIGIAGGSALFGVPLAIPIGVLVFLGSFIPIVGAVITGALAVFIALVYNGPVIALVILGIVLLVQQVEGHILQPLIMGTAVKVHPLAVVLAVASGSFVGGIAGAFFAVPVVATANSMIHYVALGTWKSDPPPSPAIPVPPGALEARGAGRSRARALPFSRTKDQPVD
jgi:predicted PurR-regulated permease PerM